MHGPAFLVSDNFQAILKYNNSLLYALAVGHLADGTMVIVQRADHLIGDTVGVQVTSVTTTSHGRLVFAKLAHP